uniref:HAT C-terminal dimerisation domain-containing protein n=1 Tax=Cajanus cajan TaxID=3821 RepID=A0A151R0Z9_CAJCA|nr:hypothetical protein KK1_042728 [Cajanus cajan]
MENLVTNRVFWIKFLNCMRGIFPLVKVLHLVDSDEKPTIGFIYEEMDQAKEKIQNAFKGDETRRKTLFGHPIAQCAFNTKSLVEWWESYGDKHLELQQFAIQVLSLTCSSFIYV